MNKTISILAGLHVGANALAVGAVVIGKPGLPITSTGEAVLDATGTITGKILDARTQLPVAAAVVAVKGTALRASTDAYGEFVLEKVPVGGVVLKVSRTGYKSRELAVSVSGGESSAWTMALTPEKR